jgi:hypothetical protein
MFEILIFYPRLVEMVTKTISRFCPFNGWYTTLARRMIFDFLPKRRMERERRLLLCVKELKKNKT